jgi:ABC-type transporter Mla subunit MlaD
MPQERNAFRLGLTLIAFFLLALGVLAFLAPRGGGDMAVQVRFPHNQFATTIKTGGEVACGGQVVGTVKRIQLLEMKDPSSGYNTLYTVLTTSVDSSLGLRSDCKIIPEGLLLGGPGRLVILDRGVGEPVKPGQMVEGQSAADFSALTRLMASQLDPKDPASLLGTVKGQLDATDPRSLLGKIHASLADVNAITSSVRNEFDPQQKAVLMAKLHAIFDNVNEVTARLKGEMDARNDAAVLNKVHDMLDALNRGLISAVAIVEENRQPIKDTVGHLHNTSDILEKQIAVRIAQQLDPAEAAGLLAKVHVAMDRLGTSLKDVNVITESGRETITLNKDQINGMIVNLKETSDHLKAASKEIRRNPWRLLYQPTVEEASQANVFDAARAFSEAATRLDDSLTRLQALSQSAPQNPDQQRQLRDVLQQVQQSFGQFHKVETALWEQLKIK